MPGDDDIPPHWPDPEHWRQGRWGNPVEQVVGILPTVDAADAFADGTVTVSEWLDAWGLTTDRLTGSPTVGELEVYALPEVHEWPPERVWPIVAGYALGLVTGLSLAIIWWAH